MPSILRIALLLWFAPTALALNTITGSVRNQSRGQPAVGDEVILFRLEQRMEEEQQTKTDAHGAFLLNIQHPDQPYLVRVKHQNVNYDQRAAVGGAMTISVFDVEQHVPGVSGTIEMLRAGITGKSLHVSDMFELSNASSPPFTQDGAPTFEVCLPVGAKLDSVLAAGPDKIGFMISAAPVPGKPGFYGVNFPLLPGTTKFAFNYDLPYNGHAAFRTWHAYPLQMLAVMIPTTMTFSSLSSKFQIIGTGAGNYQVRAVGQVMAEQGPAFTISGTGGFPELQNQTWTDPTKTDQTKTDPTKTDPSTTSLPAQLPIVPESARSGSDRRAAPLSGQTSSGSAISPWWRTPQSLLAGCILLASFTVVAWRARKKRRRSAVSQSAVSSCRERTQFLDGLKNRLFQLESAKIRGSISEKDYASARQALEQSIERAVAGGKDSRHEFVDRRSELASHAPIGPDARLPL